MKKKFVSIALASGLLFSAMTGTAFAADFSDTQGHWASDAINQWSNAGVVQGIGDNQFNPNGSMTRAEAAQTFVNLLKLPAAKEVVTGFDDMTPGAWYEAAISACVENGILNGVEENLMDPNGTVTREQFFVMFARALGIPSQTSMSKAFADADNVSGYATGAINALVNNGFVKGYTATTIAPKDNIDRASVVTLLSQTIVAYATSNGTVSPTSDGIVLVLANQVTVSGAADVTVVAAKEGAAVTFSDYTGEASVIALENNVTVTGAPAGTTVTVAEGVTGTTVNGTAVSADSSYTVPGVVAASAGGGGSNSPKSSTQTSTPDVVIGDTTYKYDATEKTYYTGEGDSRENVTIGDILQDAQEKEGTVVTIDNKEYTYDANENSWTTGGKAVDISTLVPGATDTTPSNGDEGDTGNGDDGNGDDGNGDDGNGDDGNGDDGNGDDGDDEEVQVPTIIDVSNIKYDPDEKEFVTSDGTQVGDATAIVTSIEDAGVAASITVDGVEYTYTPEQATWATESGSVDDIDATVAGASEITLGTTTYTKNEDGTWSVKPTEDIMALADESITMDQMKIMVKKADKVTILSGETTLEIKKTVVTEAKWTKGGDTVDKATVASAVTEAAANNKTITHKQGTTETTIPVIATGLKVIVGTGDTAIEYTYADGKWTTGEDENATTYDDAEKFLAAAQTAGIIVNEATYTYMDVIGWQDKDGLVVSNMADVITGAEAKHDTQDGSVTDPSTNPPTTKVTRPNIVLDGKEYVYDDNEEKYVIIVNEAAEQVSLTDILESAATDTKEIEIGGVKYTYNTEAKEWKNASGDVVNITDIATATNIIEDIDDDDTDSID